jgi:hypothetical protein
LQLSRGDYRTALAIEATRERLYAEVRNGRRDLSGIPRRLDMPVIVICSDNRLVLTKRSPHVHYYPGAWSISVGESIDAKMDVDAAGQLSLRKTAIRALTEFDELNLPKEEVQAVPFKCVSLITEWPYLLVNIITVARLPVNSAFLFDHFVEGEHTRLATVPFDINTCLALVIQGEYTIPDMPTTQGRIIGTARLALLTAMFSEFGFEEVNRRI